jgi:hypothetical protein
MDLENSQFLTGDKKTNESATTDANAKIKDLA